MSARTWAIALLSGLPALAAADGEHTMSYREMADMMGMDDRARFHKVSIDELEWAGADRTTLAWDASAWYGGDFDKLRLETEGERTDVASHSRTELQWDHVVSRWWSVRAGWRHDAGAEPRDWASFGVAGLAPGLIELTASVYVGEQGRTALRFEADRDLLLTQRLVLRPEIEVEARDDGTSDLTAGLRLRYELRREVAPYVGARWVSREHDAEFMFVAGLRLWF